MWCLLPLAPTLCCVVFYDTVPSSGWLGLLLFGGILVPVIYAALFVEGESLSSQQLLAIGMMLVAFVLMNVKEIRLKGTKPIYYVYCVLLFLCNGFYGTLLKMQSVHYEEQKDAMVNFKAVPEKLLSATDYDVAVVRM